MIISIKFRQIDIKCFTTVNNSFSQGYNEINTSFGTSTSCMIYWYGLQFIVQLTYIQILTVGKFKKKKNNKRKVNKQSHIK